MPKTTEEMIAVMQAFVEGKKIEGSVSGKTWELTEAPLWDWRTVDYRVAEELPLPIERWALVSATGYTLAWGDERTIHEAKKQYPGCRVVHMKEVRE